MSQDVTHNDFAIGRQCGGCDFFGGFDGIGQRLFNKHVAARFQSRCHEACVGVWPSRNANGVWLGCLKCFVEVLIGWIVAAQFFVQLCTGLFGTGANADDFKPIDGLVGQRMRPAHVSGTDAQDANAFLVRSRITHRIVSPNVAEDKQSAAASSSRYCTSPCVCK